MRGLRGPTLHVGTECHRLIDMQSLYIRVILSFRYLRHSPDLRGRAALEEAMPSIARPRQLTKAASCVARHDDGTAPATAINAAAAVQREAMTGAERKTFRPGQPQTVNHQVSAPSGQVEGLLCDAHLRRD